MKAKQTQGDVQTGDHRTALHKAWQSKRGGDPEFSSNRPTVAVPTPSLPPSITSAGPQANLGGENFRGLWEMESTSVIQPELPRRRREIPLYHRSGENPLAPPERFGLLILHQHAEARRDDLGMVHEDLFLADDFGADETFPLKLQG